MSEGKPETMETVDTAKQERPDQQKEPDKTTTDDGTMTTDDGTRTRNLTTKAKDEYDRAKDSYKKKLKRLKQTLEYELESYENDEKNSYHSVELCKSRVNSAFSKYQLMSNDYSQYLERKRTDDSLREMANNNQALGTISNGVDLVFSDMDKQIAKLEKPKSVRSRSSRTSRSSTQTMIEKKMKAEAAKATLEYAQKEAELKKIEAEMEMKKVNIKTDIELLNKQKDVAVAMAEYKASVEESSSESDSQSLRSLNGIPKDDSQQRTQNYVNEQSSSLGLKEQNEDFTTKLDPNADTFVPQHKDTITHKTRHQDDPVNRRQRHNTQNFSSPPQQSSDLSEFSKFLLKKDLLASRFIKFSDQPEQFAIWKSSFRTIIQELDASPFEEAELLVKWLGPESSKFAQSIRTSNINDPLSATTKIWKRLEERFGGPEMVEISLRSKLDNFPRITFKDKKQMYDLHDLLCEIQSNKDNPMYEKLLSYFDTSVGVTPVVMKLPPGMQSKWRDRATSYKKKFNVAYPPFSYFVEFIEDQASVYNDPGFNFETDHHHRNEKTKSERSKFKVQVHKTSVESVNGANTCKGERKDRTKCVIHTNAKSYHHLSDCKVFKEMAMADKRQLLKDNGICFKCLGSNDHISRNCKEQITCSKCNGTSHNTLMHIDNFKKSHTQQGQSGETYTETLVQSSCTEICKGQFTGKSCAKILLAYVSHKDNPSKKRKTYIVLDEQSNRSLGRKQLFDSFDVNCKPENYTLSTCSGKTVLSGRRFSGLSIQSLDGTCTMDLPTIIECEAIPNNRDEIPVPEVAMFHDHLKGISSELPPLDRNSDILLLIGRDLLQAHHVHEQILGPSNTAPYAQRVSLGWVVIGNTCLDNKHVDDDVKSFKTYIKAGGRPSLLKPCHNRMKVGEVLECQNGKDNYDFNEVPIGDHIFDRTVNDDKLGKSVEDKLFLQIMDSDFHKDENGNWCAPLPFKPNREHLPNNFSMAIRRAKSLDKSLQTNQEKQGHFKDFMQGLLDDGHAEEANTVDLQTETWYLPVFGVYHHKKVCKIRCVFDSSAKFGNVSLNKVLLQGPDMNNSLLGVLMRFRKNQVAAMADIRQMFYSFSVREDHRDFLRFLWHRENDFSKELVTYRMTKHVFGNSPSPAVAIYGLRKCAESADPDVKEFVHRHFYVDDGLISTNDEDDMVSLLKRTQQTLMDNGNIKLHKFASNSKMVMDALPPEDLAQDLKSVDFESDDVPLQRSLGLYWNLENDSLTFRISDEDKPYTRRGILSTLNSVFDPLGIAAPVVLGGKLILRKLMAKSVDWDEPLSEQHRLEWESWKKSLSSLQDMETPRMYLPTSLSQIGSLELHVFADASEKAISSVAYLRNVKDNGKADIGFALGKARVSPQHGHTIPRLELCAAVLAVEIAEIVLENIDHPIETIKFYTDSKVVLGYIFNQTRRFYVYVENRVERIRKATVPSQWNYVPTATNPADLGTRSVPPENLSGSSWIHGPIKFLNQKQEITTQEDLTAYIVPDADKEVRPSVSVAKTVTDYRKQPVNQSISSRFDKFSELNKLVQAIAFLQRWLKSRSMHKEQMDSIVPSLNQAELFLMRVIQNETYEMEIECIRNGQNIPRSSSLISLDPFLDEAGLLRVGGRLNNARIPRIEKNPLILPGQAHVTRLLVRHIHAEIKHQGRHFTEGALRSAGYWIVGMKRLVSSIIHHCVLCRRLRGTRQFQKMADLPTERVEPAPPFTHVGVVAFGPWTVAHRRTRGGVANAKRWAILFTCLGTRAIHIEVVEELSSSAFINALRRFVAIRGKVTTFRSDRGTNFVGATEALHVDAINVEDNNIKKYLTDSRSVWLFNPPHASHMGGSWERLIGVTRRILDSILLESKHKFLTHDVLVTFMAEVSSIVNHRPIVPVSTDTDDPFVLSPGILLTQKTTSSDATDIIGEFDQKDLLRAEWKRVVVLSDMFWAKWRREFLSSLQPRRKWTTETPNVKEGDVVLLRDKTLVRNEWPMGLVTRTFPSQDDKVRKLEIRVIREGKATTYIRPVTEVVILVSD